MKTRIRISLITIALFATAGLFYAAVGVPFAVEPQPISVAAAPNQLIVSTFCSGNLSKVSDTAVVTPFGTIPGPNIGCVERYLAISPNLGGWTPGYVYVTQVNEVYKFAPDGTLTMPAPFATIPGCGGAHTGITFDHFGTNFNFDMIVTCETGQVARITPAGGTANVIATVPGTDFELEGPAVVPDGFGPFGGQIWAADEENGHVVAISNTGAVNTSILTWPGAESVLVIPPNPCSFGNSNGAMFSANYNLNNITKFTPADLSGLGGNVLVTSETNAGILLVGVSGGSYTGAFFEDPPASYEGSAITDCQVVPSPTPTPTATATATATATPTPTPTTTPAGVCPLTQGYWKNHPNAWPVNSLILGSQTYTKAELLNILNTPVGGDASLNLAHQLIAAKLNIAAGSDPTPISSTITHADSLLSMFSGKLPYHVPPPSTIGQMMVSDANTLDNYNNGRLTPNCSAQRRPPQPAPRP